MLSISISGSRGGRPFGVHLLWYFMIMVATGCRQHDGINHHVDGRDLDRDTAFEEAVSSCRGIEPSSAKIGFLTAKDDRCSCGRGCRRRPGDHRAVGTPGTCSGRVVNRRGRRFSAREATHCANDTSRKPLILVGMFGIIGLLFVSRSQCAAEHQTRNSIAASRKRKPGPPRWTRCLRDVDLC
jgi:hypothetical protein